MRSELFDDLLQEAINKTPVHDNGSRSDDVTIEILMGLLPPLTEDDLRRKATQIFDQRTKTPKHSEQLWLPTCERYFQWGKTRLIRGHDNTYMEAKTATPEYSQADADRSVKHAEECRKEAEEKSEFAFRHRTWAREEARQGRFDWGQERFISTAFADNFAAPQRSMV
jgi:hypothetical protein